MEGPKLRRGLSCCPSALKELPGNPETGGMDGAHQLQLMWAPQGDPAQHQKGTWPWPRVCAAQSETHPLLHAERGHLDRGTPGERVAVPVRTGL